MPPRELLCQPTKSPRTFRVQPTPQHRNERNRRRRGRIGRSRGTLGRPESGQFLRSAMKPSRKDRDVVPKARDLSLEGEVLLDGTGQNHRRPQGGGGGRGGSSLNHSDRGEARRSDEKRPKSLAREERLAFLQRTRRRSRIKVGTLRLDASNYRRR